MKKISLKMSFTLSLLVLLLFSALMFAALQLILEANKSVDRVSVARYNSYLLADEVRKSSQDFVVAVRAFVTTGDPRYEARYWDIAAIGTGKKERPDGRTVARLELMKQAGFTAQELAKLQQAQTTSFTLIKREEQAMNTMKGLYQDNSGNYTIKREPDPKLARELVYDSYYESEAAKVQAQAGEFIVMLDQRTKAAFEAATQSSFRAYSIGLAVLLLMLAAMSIALMLVFRLVSRNLTGCARVAEKLATGDLSAKLNVKGNDEIGRLNMAINGIGDGLANIVANVRGGSDAIHVASAEIASGNNDLASHTESQASSLQQTVLAMAQLTNGVKQNADSALQANRLVMSAAELASKGQLVVNDVVETMSSIKQSSSQIADIISVIDSIAFQTNILALNAAVEAARAGEQGRGFAVVASEVRNLAQRSATAAKEIKTLIADSVEKVDSGEQLVAKAGATMGEISSSVKLVVNIMGKISSASVEQSNSIDGINHAITQIDAITQQNSALVEQASNAAESLREQADLLSKEVSVFIFSLNDDLELLIPARKKRHSGTRRRSA